MSIPFTSTTVAPTGESNLAAETVLRKHLNPTFKGRVWEALLAALGDSDERLWELARNAIDQLFLSTAEGIYLERKASDYGVNKPQGLGLDDETFRNLVISYKNKKLTQQSILELLEVFYGTDSVRAYAETTSTFPVIVAAGSLEILVDGRDTYIVTVPAHPGGITALDLAEVINHSLRKDKASAYAAVAVADVTAIESVRIYSGKLGLASSIQVSSGAAQVALGLPLTRQTIFKPYGRTVSVSQTGGRFDVSIPATTIAVNRGVGSAAYLKSEDAVQVDSVTRDENGIVTITTATDHNLTAGGQVLVEGVVSDLVAPAITAGDRVGPPLTTDYSDKSLWTGLVTDPTAFSYYASAAVDIGSNKALVIGGYQLAPGQVDVDACMEVELTASGADYEYTTTAMTGMDDVRSYGVAMLLNRGDPIYDRVLICGGYDDTVAATLDASELYYIGADAWNVVAPPPAMSAPRALHTLTALDNHRILICGGFDTQTTIGLTVDIYDHGDETMTAAASMSVARALHDAVLLDNGKVLVCGGISASDTGITSGGFDPPIIATAGGVDTSMASAEIYNPATNTWTATGSMAWARQGHKLVKLEDGRVLAIGGHGFRYAGRNNFSDFIADVEVYDPVTGCWGLALRFPLGRWKPIVASLPSRHQIFVGFGSSDSGGPPLPINPSSHFIDTRTWALSQGPNYVQGLAPSPCEPETGCTIAGELVLAAGGVTDADYALMVPGVDTVAGGGFNGTFRVLTTPTPTTFTYETVSARVWSAEAVSGATITAVAASRGSDVGPYILDTTSGPVIVPATDTTLSMAVVGGVSYRELTVTSTAGFPESGYLVLGFGTASETYPVPYLVIKDATTFIIDKKFIFPRDIASGSRCTLLSGRGNHDLASPNPENGLYLTANSAGLTAAQTFLEGAVAAGSDVNVEVVYPGDQGLGKAGTENSDKYWVWGGDNG